MANSAIKKIEKVNVYQEDNNNKKTLIQSNVPIGTNVVYKKANSSDKNGFIDAKETNGTITLTNHASVYVSSNILCADSIKEGGTLLTNKYIQSISTVQSGNRKYLVTSQDKTATNVLLSRQPTLVVQKENGTDSVEMTSYSISRFGQGDNRQRLWINVDAIPRIDDANGLLPSKEASSQLSNADCQVLSGNTIIAGAATGGSFLKLWNRKTNTAFLQAGVDTSNSRTNYGYFDVFKILNGKPTMVGSIFGGKDQDGFTIAPRKKIYDSAKNTYSDDENVIVDQGQIGTQKWHFADGYINNLHFKALSPNTDNGELILNKLIVPTANKKSISVYEASQTNFCTYINIALGQQINKEQEKQKKTDYLPDGMVNGFCLTLRNADETQQKQILFRQGTSDTTDRFIYMRTKHGKQWSSYTKYGACTIVQDFKASRSNKIKFNRNYLDIFVGSDSERLLKTGFRHSSAVEAAKKLTKKQIDNNFTVNLSANYAVVFKCNNKNIYDIIFQGVINKKTGVSIAGRVKMYD